MLLVIFSINNIYSQDITEDTNILQSESGEVFTEEIKIISASKKIFILTNSNKMLSKGDFVTLALNGQPLARALVAKTAKNERAGIKIMKIISLKTWTLVKQGSKVQLIKGDDSFIRQQGEVKLKETNKNSTEQEIKEIEDLYNTELTDDENDLDIKDDKKRNIKTDNIVTVAWGRVTAREAEDYSEFTNNQIYGMWAYQFKDNIWAEFVYGNTTISNYPADGASTRINNFIIRFLYSFELPYDSYAMPYLGYQSFYVSSPDAGNNQNVVIAGKEEEVINELDTSGVKFGVSFLKRLVPGWFAKAHVGTDGFAIGLAVEF